MTDETKKEIESIIKELDSISTQIDNIADGMERNFKGIGEKIYSQKLRSYALKYRAVKKDLSNIK